MAGDIVISTINGGAIGSKNVVINGNFGINQRGVSGTVVLAAGVYGHDRFKAGASGCTYTFATVANVTTLTISAGSLVQVVEGLNLQLGTYTLSWTGTAQGKINGGSYAGSGLTGTATGGTNLTVEFSTGSLSFVQLEKGSTATAYDFRDYGRELIMCQRYYEVLYSESVGNGLFSAAYTTQFRLVWPLKVEKRAVPTFSFVNGSVWGGGTGTPATFASTSLIGFFQSSGAYYMAGSAANAPLASASAEL